MSAMQSLQARWATLAPREKALVLVAALLVTLVVVWWLAIAPALGTIRQAAAQHQTLDAQLARMRALQAQAQVLQSQPRQSADESLKALEQTIRQRLGTTARYSIAGDRVTVPDGPGLGLAPDEGAVARYAVGRWDLAGGA